MKYRIPSIYYSESTPRIVDKWIKSGCLGRLNFRDFLVRESYNSQVQGNFEDGWIIEFDNEAKYIWFLLKHGEQ